MRQNHLDDPKTTLFSRHVRLKSQEETVGFDISDALRTVNAIKTSSREEERIVIIIINGYRENNFYSFLHTKHSPTKEMQISKLSN